MDGCLISPLQHAFDKSGHPPEAALFPLAEVPGLPRKHLAAQLDNESGLLIISGSYPAESATSSIKIISQEHRPESFRWEFRLPEDVALEGFSAKLDNGELTGEQPLPGSSCHCLDCIWPEAHVHILDQPAVLFALVQLLHFQMLCQHRSCGTLSPARHFASYSCLHLPPYPLTCCLQSPCPRLPSQN